MNHPSPETSASPDPWISDEPHEPSSIPSIAPMAMNSEDEAPAKARGHPFASGAVAAIAMVGISTAVVLGGFSFLSAPFGVWQRGGWRFDGPAVAPIRVPAGTPEGISGDDFPSARAFAQSPGRRATGEQQEEGSVDEAPVRERTREPSNQAKDAASAALGAALVQGATVCRQGGMAPVTAVVTATFDSGGRVDDAVVRVPPAASELGDCLAREARKASIAPFGVGHIHVERMISVQ